MEDIGEKLYELIQAEFEQLTARDVRLIELSARIERGTATTRDISEYSLRLGEHLRAAIEHNVSADVLPNGRMYYNIADKILDRSLRNTYELVNDVAARIQEAVDKQQDIHIRPQKADYPTERVRAAIGAASALDITAEKMIRRMGSPAENITASFADDYMQVNAEFRSKSGMQAYIIRDDHSGCCPWCSKQAGKYAYPDNVPKDVYRRHDNCKCTVEYVTNGRKQNVHTKQQSMISPEDRERMAALSEKGSVRLSPEEAAEAERKALEVMAQKSGKMLTDEVGSGIIKSRSIASRNLPNGLRTAPNHILTDDEINSLMEDISAIEADASVFKFNVGSRTGYDDILDEIHVKGDILPDLNSVHPRDRMSARAALAHEYYGHRAYRGTSVAKGAWNDEFRASYMAAKNCPNLSDDERRDLVLDALERAKEAGISIKHNDFIRRTVYGY